METTSNILFTKALFAMVTVTAKAAYDEQTDQPLAPPSLSLWVCLTYFMRANFVAPVQLQTLYRRHHRFAQMGGTFGDHDTGAFHCLDLALCVAFAA